MEKSKVGYNIYYNERLKKVNFHGVETYPIYVNINYQRKSIFFKSYCFELFADSRFGMSKKLKNKAPTLENVIECETKLIELIVNDLGKKLVLKEFKSAYDLQCKDLCSHTAEGFLVFMFLFFSQNSASNFANALSIGSKELILYNVLQELKKVLRVELYEELIHESIQSKQAYLPVYNYATTNTDFPLPYFPVISWKNIEMRKRFIDFLAFSYSPVEVEIICNGIKGWISKLS